MLIEKSGRKSRKGHLYVVFYVDLVLFIGENTFTNRKKKKKSYYRATADTPSSG